MISRFKGFLILITIILSISSIFAYTRMQENYCYQKGFATSGVHACIDIHAYAKIWGHHSYYLTLVNNTPYAVLPAHDVTVSQWQLFRKTDTGWQKFDHYFVGPYEIPNINNLLLPQQIQKYDINVSLGRHAHDPIISPDSGLKVSFEDIPFGFYSGDYMIEIEYIMHQPQEEKILETYTNVFIYKQPSANPVLIKIRPTLLKQNNRQVVEFMIFNESKQGVWLRPLGLVVQGVDGMMDAEHPDIIIMRQVDETSWEYVDYEWSILKNSDQSIKIRTGETRQLKGVDFDTEFNIDKPGIYRWIMPIYLEYFPNAKEPRLNKRRFLFSETIEVN